MSKRPIQIGHPLRFWEPIEDVVTEVVSPIAHDGVMTRGIYYRPKHNPKPKVAVLAVHPRSDFHQLFVFPALLRAGYACLGGNARNINHDSNAIQENILLDVGAYVNWLKAQGIEQIVFAGMSAGSSMMLYYHDQASKSPSERLATNPAGGRTRLQEADLSPADGFISIASHLGQGPYLPDIVDPSIVDEANPLLRNAELDMYDPANGFRTPGEWCEYSDEFLDRYRAAQKARIKRVDDRCLSILADNRRAKARADADGFDELSLDWQRGIQNRQYYQPVITVPCTAADPRMVDKRLDPSNRDYGCLFGPRPHLINNGYTGFARTHTPASWLSTWSANHSNSDIRKNGPSMTGPSVVINAGKDVAIYHEAHTRQIHDCLGGDDKTYLKYDNALHFFQPHHADDDLTDLRALGGDLVGWLRERFPL